MYNIDLLIETADPQIVAEAIGLRVERKGKNVFCQCPSHRKMLGRDDSKVSNCVLTPRGYHCFACGAKGNVVHMVMDHYNVPFVKAVKTVASITGGNFEINNEKTVKKQPFSAEDLALIGITSIANPDGDAGKEIIGVFKSRPETGVFFRRGDEYVLYSSAKRITLNDLFLENEDVYYELIEKNAKISLEKYRTLYNSFNDRGGETFGKIFNILSVDGKVDGALMSEIKNAFLLNIRRTEKILEKAKRKGKMPKKS